MSIIVYTRPEFDDLMNQIDVRLDALEQAENPDPPTPPPSTDYVKITTCGDTFAMSVSTKSTNTRVTWMMDGWQEPLVTKNPDINFGSAATREIYMRATQNDGTGDLLSDITVFNIGFSHQTGWESSQGKYELPERYDLESTPVSGLQYVNHMTGLQYLLIQNSTLTGPLNLSGMSDLRYIEAWGAKLTSIDLTGCSSVLKLNLMYNNITYLDLNPIADSVLDVLIGRNGGEDDHIVFNPLLTKPLRNCYRFECDDRMLINGPTSAQLPVVEDLLIDYIVQQTPFVVRSSKLTRLIARGLECTSADLAYQFTTPGPWSTLCLEHSHNLQSVILTGCNQLDDIDLSDCSLTMAAVDDILRECDSWGTSYKNLRLDGPYNSAPSANNPNLASLRSKGWYIDVEE